MFQILWLCSILFWLCGVGSGVAILWFATVTGSIIVGAFLSYAGILSSFVAAWICQREAERFI
jgi:hypothetical protein